MTISPGDAGATEFVRMPSGLLVPEKHALAQLQRERRPVAVDLFCGAGGFSLGAIKGGVEVIAGVDNDPLCALTYTTNLSRYGELAFHYVEEADRQRLEDALQREMRRASGKKKRKLLASVHTAGSGWIRNEPRSTPGVRHFIFGDIAKLTGERLLGFLGMKVGELDLMFGSPPCQGFSISGKRRPDDPRNNLLWDFARLIVECRPKSLCMENVPGIVSMMTPDGLPVLDVFCRILGDGGFQTVDAIRRSMQAQGLAITRGLAPRDRKKRDAAPVAAEAELPLFASLSAAE